MRSEGVIPPQFNFPTYNCRDYAINDFSPMSCAISDIQLYWYIFVVWEEILRTLNISKFIDRSVWYYCGNRDLVNSWNKFFFI